MMPNTLVLYHGHCADGFGAAWAAWTALGDQATYQPVQYGAPTPDVAGYDTLYCLDFSYPRGTILQWQVDHARVVVLDHHKTAEAELAGLDGCTFDMDKSGAMLAWEHFRPGEKPSALVEYVQDRDLWRWALPSSRAVSAALWSYPMDFWTWRSIAYALETSPQRFIEQGEAILRYMDQQVALICDQARVIGPDQEPLGGYYVPVVNATNLWSEVGEELLRRYPEAPFVGAYYDTKHGLRKWSLRSRGDFDVSEVARKHRGGGHRAAAGFEERR